AGDPLGIRGRTVGGYRVGPPLESDHSGLVYLGWDQQGREVFLQFFDAKREQHARLRDQGAAWRAFQHPVFLRVLDFHAESPSFVAVEKRAGWLLCERLASGPLEPQETLKLVQLLAQGLAAAHAAGLQHLGISEETILLPRYEDDLPQV